ncbi:endonuclease/exonuclease/phosphatase family protein [Nonomuraea sp. B10E8]|uniref:endonuclease/exonuclease/phosphatase family protein n=1 Tax=Nonomuraea sp. B10E8 TaxID=3153559 RepID=UPI00325D5D0D
MNQPPARGLRVGTWNVREGWKGEGDDTGTHDVVRLIQDLDLDVLALQEVPFHGGRSPMLESIAGQTPLRHVAGHVLSQAMHVPGSAGIALAARLPLEDVNRVILPNPELAANGLRSFDKGLMTARMPWQGRMIAVAGLHMVPFGRFGRRAEDPAFSHVWDRAGKEIERVMLPLTFVGGDFNTPRRDLLGLPLEPVHSTGRDAVLHSEGARAVTLKTVETFSDHPALVVEFALAWSRNHRAG